MKTIDAEKLLEHFGPEGTEFVTFYRLHQAILAATVTDERMTEIAEYVSEKTVAQALRLLDDKSNTELAKKLRHVAGLYDPASPLPQDDAKDANLIHLNTRFLDPSDVTWELIENPLSGKLMLVNEAGETVRLKQPAGLLPLPAEIVFAKPEHWRRA